jgi:type II secretory pathway component PulJ
MSRAPRQQTLAAAAFTLVELLVALAVTTVVAVLAVVALSSSKKPLTAGVERTARVAELRPALDRMERELRSARQVLFPPPRADGAPSAAERLLVFRDFDGRFVMYSFDDQEHTLRRTSLPLDGLPAEDETPLASGLNEALFTVSRRKLVSTLLVREGVPVLHSVRMLNG